MHGSSRLLLFAIACGIGLSAALLGATAADDKAAHTIAERFATAARDAEEAKKRAEADRVAAAKKEAEARRKAADAKRKAEVARRSAEQLRADEAEMLERARAEAAERAAEEAAANAELQKAEAQRKAAEEAQRLDAEARALDAERIKREADVAEQARVAAEADRRAAEARAAADAEAARQAAEAKAAEDQKRAAAEAKARDDARIAAEAAAKIEESRKEKEAAEQRLILEAEREAEAIRLSEKIRKAREAREARLKPGPEPIAAPTTIPDLAVKEASRAIAPAEPATTRVTVLLVMSPGDKGIRRVNKSADPMLCVAEVCYISTGAGTPATAMPRWKAFGPGVALGSRAGACSNSVGCIFRNVDLESASALIQPIDLRIMRHDRREPSDAKADVTCALDGERLACRGGISSATWKAWIVPETLAARAGAGPLKAALAENLGVGR